MRKFLIVFLLVLLAAGSAAAWDDYGYGSSVAVVAWLEGTTLNVALGNTSNNRTTVTISTTTNDAWGRPIFPSRQVNIPGRTIVVETFYPSTPGWGEKLTSVRISEGFRSSSVPVQEPGIFKLDSYVVPANTNLTISVELDRLLDDSGRTRIVVDDYYTTSDGYGQDRIRIDSVGGGPTQVRGSNAIEYVKPFLVLKTKAPNIPTLTTFTFGLNKVDSSYNWWQERFEGPTIMVYGRNMRFSESSPGTGGTGRVAR